MSKYGITTKGEDLWPCEICTDLTANRYRYCKECREDLNRGNTASDIRFQVYKGMKQFIKEKTEAGKINSVRRYQ